MKRFYLGVVGLLAGVVMLLGMGGSAMAATANSYLYVYTNVAAYCLVNTNSVYFPNYDGNFQQQTGSVNVGCSTSNTPYEIALDAGQNYNGSRRMTNYAGSFLQYELIDGAITHYWGDNGVTHYGSTEPGNSGTGGTWVSYTVVGWLYGGQVAAEGWHDDAVYVTVNY